MPKNTEMTENKVIAEVAKEDPFHAMELRLMAERRQQRIMTEEELEAVSRYVHARVIRDLAGRQGAQ